MSRADKRKKSTIPSLGRKMAEGTPITMITCYDYAMAHLVEDAAVDMDLILVGDSLGMTVLGYPDTLKVTMEDMIRHGGAVRRGAPDTFLVVDMPYMSYQPSDELAVRNAGALMAGSGADAVKLEGGREMAARVEAIASAGIPVMGHIGLTPQSASSLGGFRLQGKTASRAATILEDARVLEASGTFSILVELVPDPLCRLITERSSQPVIGLGSGPAAHGQLLIFHDLFGLYPNFKPRMAKQYADVGAVIRRGLGEYTREVRRGDFPGAKNWFSMEEGEVQALLRSAELGPKAEPSPPPDEALPRASRG